MQKIVLYPHGGSENHGCEALVRSTIQILNSNNVVLASKDPKQDEKYGIDSLCLIVPQISSQIHLIKRLWANIRYRLLGDKLAFEANTYSEILKYVDNDTICLSFGGDNYCYGKPVYLYLMNKLFKQRGAKTVLWGCSIDPDCIDEEMFEDLKSYDVIIAREPITYNGLTERGLKNVKCAADPAFVLKCDKSAELPANFIPDNTVGINLSPMVMSYSTEKRCLQKNYENLIEFIIANTNMNVALIPHVVWSDNDDRKTLDILFKKYKSTNRICMTPDCNCEQIKGFVSRCRFLITARTHASIAAYSTGVPTLVMGYSVKAKGIAEYIFGTSDNYVLSVRDLNDDAQLTESFKYLMKNELQIREILKTKALECESSAMHMADYLC